MWGIDIDAAYRLLFPQFQRLLYQLDLLLYICLKKLERPRAGLFDDLIYPLLIKGFIRFSHQQLGLFLKVETFHTFALELKQSHRVGELALFR